MFTKCCSWCSAAVCLSEGKLSCPFVAVVRQPVLSVPCCISLCPLLAAGAPAQGEGRPPPRPPPPPRRPSTTTTTTTITKTRHTSTTPPQERLLTLQAAMSKPAPPAATRRPPRPDRRPLGSDPRPRTKWQTYNHGCLSTACRSDINVLR